MSFKNRVLYLLKQRLRNPFLVGYYAFMIMILFVISYNANATVVYRCFFFLIPISGLILHLIVPILIESKYYLIGVCEHNGIVSITYLKYNTEMIFKTQKNLLKIRKVEEQTKGIVFDESVVIGEKTSKFYFKKRMVFYLFENSKKEILEKKLQKIIADVADPIEVSLPGLKK
jgi:hypothetical protein